MASIEFLFLANHAEVQNGLLYASGGGWYQIYRFMPEGESQPPTNHFAIATSVLVPWEETNQPHRLNISIVRDGDGPLLVQAEVAIEVGRPPGLLPGTDQRAVFALPIDIAFPEQGVHRVVAQVGEETRSVIFKVQDHRVSLPPEPVQRE